MGHCRLSVEAWARGLITRLLEMTHGQWVHRNTLVHNRITGTIVNCQKEELQKAIKDQLALGEEGLDEQDWWLLEINLGDLEAASGNDHQYWLLAIEAARLDYALRARSLNRDVSRSHRGCRA